MGSSYNQGVGGIMKYKQTVKFSTVQRTFIILLMVVCLVLLYKHPLTDVITTRSTIQILRSEPKDEMVRLTRVQLEEIRRQVSSGIRNAQAYFHNRLRSLAETVSSNKTKEVKKIKADAEERLRTLQFDASSIERLGDLKAWREREAASLVQEVQAKIHAVQNPPDCATARKLLCDMKRIAGAGSLIHHLQSCIMNAYGNGMTFVLDSKGWNYSPDGWEVVFQPVSCCHNVTEAIDNWPGSPGSKAIRFPKWDNPGLNLPYGPMALPADIATRVQRFHESPSDWWAGQFVTYLMRPRPELQQMIEKARMELNFSHPIAGIQVRRTNKKGEAKFYPIEDYMYHVENYFHALDLESPTGVPVARKVYLATELRAIIPEAIKKYPGYEFVYRNNTAENLKDRYTVPSLRDFMIDLYFLARVDHLICTFSSNVCRLAYELMQSVTPDAPSKVISLDKTYFMFNQPRPQLYKIRFPLAPEWVYPENTTGIQAYVGQIFRATIYDEFGTGFIRLENPRRRKSVFFVPDYKVTRVLDALNITLPNHVKVD